MRADSLRASTLSRVLVLLGALSMGGCAHGYVRTVVTVPAQAKPGEVAFGKGVTVSKGTKLGSTSADAVVVASASDPDGPTDRSEGDSVWRVRGGMLELCEWADDGRDDCRLATYEGFSAPPLLAFVPTIIEPGNIGRGSQLIAGGDNPAIVGDVAKHKTQSLPFSRERSIWVTAGALALVGAQPAFFCSATAEGPRCQALPLMVSSSLGVFGLRHNGDVSSVLWIHAAANVGVGLGALPADLGVYRCEGVKGAPSCKKAQVTQ